MRWLRALALVGLAGCAARGFEVRAVWGGVGKDAAPRWVIDNPRDAVFSPDGTRALVVGDEARLFAAPSGELLLTLPYAYLGWGIGALAFSPDGKRFAIVDGTRACAAVWTLAPLRETACVPADNETSVAFSPDGAALAVATAAEVSRWSLATGARVWRTAAPLGGPRQLLAWPAPDLIVYDDPAWHAVALDAATGTPRWTTTERVTGWVGVLGGDAIVLGDRVLARMALATGALHDATPTDEPTFFAAAFPDGTATIENADGYVTRYRVGGAAIGSYLWPPNTREIAARRDGTLALLATNRGVQLVDPRTGAPFEPDRGDAQAAPILALDATASSVIAVAADGSVVERRIDGTVRARGHMRAHTCLAAAASAVSREAVCAADVAGTEGAAAYDPPTHEWLSLADGGARAVDWFAGGVIALDPHVTWLATQGRAVFAPPAARVPLTSHVPRWLPPDLDAKLTPRAAALVSAGLAVAYGGAMYDGSFEQHTGRGWAGTGLALMDRAGAVTMLAPAELVIALGASRAGDVLAVADLDRVALWRRDPGANKVTAWRRAWTAIDDPGPALAIGTEVSAVAVSETGALVAAAIRDQLVLFDAATGARIAALALGDREVTALAFGPGTLYAGTRTGLVLAVDVRHPNR